MKRVNIRNPHIYVNSGITLCYFILAVFLFDGLAHFVVGATISISFVWYYYTDWMKRPQIHLLPLWTVLSVWFCVGEFENAVFASSSHVAVRDMLWILLIVASYTDQILEKSHLSFRIAWGAFLASGIALSTTDGLARRMGMLTMSYKVSICICMYVACELLSNLKKNKMRNDTKFNIFQSSWVLFCWNSISILAMFQLVYLVYQVVSNEKVATEIFRDEAPLAPKVCTADQPILGSSPFTAASEYKPVIHDYTETMNTSPSNSNPSTPYVGGPNSSIPLHPYSRSGRQHMTFRSNAPMRPMYGRAAYEVPLEQFDENE